MSRRSLNSLDERDDVASAKFVRHMPVATKSTQFLFLSERRYEESIALLKQRCFHGSFYLAGYVIECAIKAALAKFVGGGTLPATLQVHDIEILSAYLQPHIDSPQALAALQSVPNWTHLARYDTAAPSPHSVIRLLERAKDVKVCLSKLI